MKCDRCGIIACKKCSEEYDQLDREIFGFDERDNIIRVYDYNIKCPKCGHIYYNNGMEDIGRNIICAKCKTRINLN